MNSAELTKKLNDEHLLRVQGGSILVILKLISDEVASLELLISSAESHDVDVPSIAHERLAALDAIGSNLFGDAKKIFGQEYLMNVLLEREGGIGVSEIIAEPDHTLN